MLEPRWEADAWRCFGCQDVERTLGEVQRSNANLDGLRIRLFPIGR